MILKVANIGPVKEANIDLSKSFTLFCGQNSTGKTYISYILYAFLEDSGVAHLQCIESIKNQILNTNSFQITKAQIEQWLSSKCDSVSNNLANIFGVSDDTCNNLFLDFNIDFLYTDEDFQRTINIPMDFSFSINQHKLNIKKEAKSDIVNIQADIDFSFFNGTYSSIIIRHILKVLTFNAPYKPRMFTVERNSIYTFKTELSISRNELIDKIQQNSQSDFDIINIINTSSRRYPQTIKDSLKVANDLYNVQKSSSQFAAVAEMIEKDMLCGEVSMTKDGDVEYHSVGMEASKRLPFHLSSSIVKTMASLVIYLRHSAQKGDVLIIDEPEMNFHPDVQLILTCIFAKLSNMGLKIVVSTHSDYIVREINNLIMAKAIDNKALYAEYGYSEDMLLDYKNIDVLYFAKDVNINSLPINEEGFSIPSIDSTIERQNIIAQTLYCALLDKMS